MPSIELSVIKIIITITIIIMEKVRVKKLVKHYLLRIRLTNAIFA